MNGSEEGAAARLTEIIFPEKVNHHGTLFAGEAFSLMGKAAVIAGTRLSRRQVVMAAAEQVDFMAPIQVGQVLDCVARVETVRQTSMVVTIEAFAESLATAERSLVIRGRFIMVAVDEAGRPVSVGVRVPECRGGSV